MQQVGRHVQETQSFDQLEMDDKATTIKSVAATIEFIKPIVVFLSAIVIVDCHWPSNTI